MTFFGRMRSIMPVVGSLTAGTCLVGAFTMGGYYYTMKERLTDIWKEVWDKTLTPGWDSGDYNRAAKYYLNYMISTEDLPVITDPRNYKPIRVFVPLCGASRDMVAIARHLQKIIPHEYSQNYQFEVMGVEKEEQPIQHFLEREYRKLRISEFLSFFTF